MIAMNDIRVRCTLGLGGSCWGALPRQEARGLTARRLIEIAAGTRQDSEPARRVAEVIGRSLNDHQTVDVEVALDPREPETSGTPVLLDDVVVGDAALTAREIAIRVAREIRGGT